MHRLYYSPVTRALSFWTNILAIKIQYETVGGFRGAGAEHFSHKLDYPALCFCDILSHLRYIFRIPFFLPGGYHVKSESITYSSIDRSNQEPV